MDPDSRHSPRTFLLEVSLVDFEDQTVLPRLLGPGSGIGRGGVVTRNVVSETLRPE